jgi:hypothetical protein
MENILIATAVLWFLELLFVTPLAAFFSRRSASLPVVIDGAAGVEAPAPKAGVDTASYILASALVLGTVGLILGLAGYWFVGFSTKAKGWPGMIAFILLSLIGYQMSKGF